MLPSVEFDTNRFLNVFHTFNSSSQHVEDGALEVRAQTRLETLLTSISTDSTNRFSSLRRASIDFDRDFFGFLISDLLNTTRFD